MFNDLLIVVLYSVTSKRWYPLSFPSRTASAVSEAWELLRYVGEGTGDIVAHSVLDLSGILFTEVLAWSVVDGRATFVLLPAVSFVRRPAMNDPPLPLTEDRVICFFEGYDSWKYLYYLIFVSFQMLNRRDGMVQVKN